MQDNTFLLLGVPEAFNFPLVWAAQRSAAVQGTALQFAEEPSGSGAMLQVLLQEKAQGAVLLTEAAALAQERYGLVPLCPWVESPLRWGIHRRPDFHASGGVRFAISRKHSGSHLMAALLAEQRGWPTETLTYVEVGKAQAGFDSIRAGRADIFLWEEYTSKSYLDEGVLQELEPLVSPWHAFTVVARPEVGQAGGENLQQLLANAVEQFTQHEEELIPTICDHYGLTRDHYQRWRSKVQWAVELPQFQANVQTATDYLTKTKAL